MSNKENSDEKIREKYSRIAKAHPKLKIFKEMDDVKIFVDNQNVENRRLKVKEGVRKAEIIRELNMSESLAKRCLGYLVEGLYLKKTGTKGPEFFFSVEKHNGDYDNSENPYKEGISKFIKRKMNWLVEFMREHKLIDENLQLEFDKMVKSINEQEPDVEPYNNLVQLGCWAKGYKEPVKFSFKRKAYRYA